MIEKIKFVYANWKMEIAYSKFLSRHINYVVMDQMITSQIIPLFKLKR